MSAFGGLLLTNRGRNLQAKAQTGNQLMFTRMGIGDGELGSSSILDLNALKHEVLSLTLTEFKVLTDGKARVRSILSNQDITTGFYFREIGIYAQDPDLGEILYCYGNAGANAEYIPAGGGPDIIEKRLDVITLIASAANVSAVIDESLIFVTLDDFEAHINGSNPHPQYATDEHMHTKAEISDFPTSMTPTGHKNTHATGGSDELTPADIGAATAGALGGVQGDVAGLQAELAAHEADDKTDAHEIININGLQTALNSKAPNVHSHSTSNITDLRIYNGELQYLDGGVWKGVATSPIKSIQRGVVESNVTGDINVTINSVNINKAIVITSGDGVKGSSTTNSRYALLSNATTLKIKQRFITSVSNAIWEDDSRVVLAWQVVEFN